VNARNTLSPEDEHTPITDEILDVIDQQSANRYAVALRLTRWYEKKLTTHTPSTEIAELDGRIKELEQISKEPSNYLISGFGGEGSEDAVPVHEINNRIAELKARRASLGERSE
jgi:hypothetical protein